MPFEKMRILVVGAGIGGLTLGNALKSFAETIQFTILERDPDIASRPQGYGINLNQMGGLKALQRLGFGDEIEKFMQVNRGLRFMTHSGDLLVALPPGTRGSKFYVAAMSREKLRTMLLNALPSDSVRWNCHVKSFEQDAAGVVRVKLDDGSELSGDLLVACDGSGSAVRKTMLNDELSYVGVSQIGGEIEATSVAHPFLEAGSFMMLGPGKSVFVLKYGERIQWNLGLRAQRGELDGLTPGQMRERALREVHGWAQPIPAIVQATAEDRFRRRILCDRPPPDRLIDRRVVLMGDAAHPVSPYRGQGANSAMLDALTLGETLGGTSEATLSTDLAGWERKAIDRVRPLILRSREVSLEYNTGSRATALQRNLRMRSLNASIRVRRWAQEHFGYRPNWTRPM